MKFVRQNKSLSIRIKGYEFEKSEFKEDLDWLNVVVEVHDYELNWIKNGAFIRTEDLEAILNLLKGESKRQKLEFLERDLSLSMIGNLLQFHLNYSLHPKGDKYNYSDDTEYILSFYLEKSEIAYAIGEVEKWIEMFPVKVRLSD